jgi:hypothetical protein
MAYACNLCADKDPNTYPAECDYILCSDGKEKFLVCEVCGSYVPLLNVPQRSDEWNLLD